jgi:dTDP-4-dehydrorhamnose reductase
MKSMKHFLCFGFGFSAAALARQLDRSRWRITGTSRSDEGVAAITALGCEGVRFDQLLRIPESVTHIVSSVPPGAGDPVIEKFGLEIAARKFEWVAYLSTTGVYGDHQGRWIDESFPLTPNTLRGEKRVAAEAQWLALHRDHHVPVHVFRLAGIYGPGRNQLLSVRDGTAKRVIKPGQIFSRIHVDDIAGILLASMTKPNPGRAYNVADDEPCPPQDVVAFAADLLGLPPPPEIAFEDAKLSPMAASFYADSKRVSNARVKHELRYAFKYPNYRAGLRACLLTL